MIIEKLPLEPAVRELLEMLYIRSRKAQLMANFETDPEETCDDIAQHGFMGGETMSDRELVQHLGGETFPETGQITTNPGFYDQDED